MDGFVYQCKKQRQRCKMKYYSLNQSTAVTIWKLWQVERAQWRAQKTCVWWMTDDWLLLQTVSLHECKSTTSQWSHHMFREFLMIKSWQCGCVVCFMNSSILLKSWFTIILSTPCSINCHATILYSCTVFKTCKSHLNHKRKFPKVSGSTFRVHFWQTILE